MKLDSIILFESNDNENFYPFSVLHPLWELRVGAMRIFEKYQRVFDTSSITFYSSNTLILDSFLERFSIDNVRKRTKKNLILSSRLLPTTDLLSELEDLIEDGNVNYTIMLAGKIVGYCTDDSIEGIEALDQLKAKNYTTVELDPETKYLNYIWDAISQNEAALIDDANYFRQWPSPKEDCTKGVHYLEKSQIFIHESVRIHPNVVIDATDGAVMIDENVKIMAGSTILGPCYIGKNSTIKVGAKIYGNTSIGEVCKVGGEVEGSIIQSYSNKQHDGFLGHSFISEWVNLGADTNTSDLKNTYSEITVLQRDNEVKTGTMFLGLICGDHTKSAINTQFNTGTIAGVCGILVRPGFLPNHIKSYSWGGLQTSPTYKYSKAIEVCEIVMGRRGKQLTDSERQLLQLEYDKVK
jgi:UDP-N-acetylglucosamine diphosphorylase/glucosamine-1-phosphate N-acetyltransferase